MHIEFSSLLQALGMAAKRMLSGVAILGLALFPWPDSSPLNSTMVAIQSAATTVQGCSTTRVEIWVNDVQGLYGADIQFTFDPAILRVQDADPGSPGVQIQPLDSFLKTDFVLKSKACNQVDPGDPDCATAGKVWYAVTQLNPTPAVTGSGPIAAIDLKAVAGGTAPLTIVYRKLSDINGVEIPAGDDDGSLEAVPPPEPQLSISAPDLVTARLTWTASVGVAEYRLYRELEPYFDPTDPPYQVVDGLSFDDVGALGNPATNHYYVVRAACANGFVSDRSNRTGEFDYRLLPAMAP